MTAESWRAQELCSEVLTSNLPHIRQCVDPKQVIYNIKDLTDAQRETIATTCQSQSQHDGAVKLYNVLKTCHSGIFCQFIEALHNSPGSSVLACKMALDFINTLNNNHLAHLAQRIMSSFPQNLQSDIMSQGASSGTVAVQCTDGTNNQTAGSTLNCVPGAEQMSELSIITLAVADNQTTESQPAEVTVDLSIPGAECSPDSMQSNVDNTVNQTIAINTPQLRNRTDNAKVLNTDSLNPNRD